MFKKKLLSFLILFTMAFALAGVANAQLDKVLTSDELTKVAKDSYNENTTVPTVTVQGMIVLVVNTVLGILGVIFLVLIIYAGFLWMTAGGSDEQVGKAKKLLINSIIGVIIIVAAYAISYFVLKAILPPQTTK